MSYRANGNKFVDIMMEHEQLHGKLDKLDSTESERKTDIKQMN